MITPPTRPASTAGIIQYRPPPAFSRNVRPATPTSTAVTVFGDARSMYLATPLVASCPARRSRTSSAAAETAATASSSAPSAETGCGATIRTALIAGVMNSTSVCAAREARLRDPPRTSLLIDTATNSSPVSAPASPATATPKSCHISGR